ncbi:A-kinase anchor protein 2 isoform X1 [Boleophthalmus pectinirostris]|uniref:A-kinase anchor protein 2 isoform X1 n=1 Tax=Boleophthalmus pectinirostris TaxID=150288 RepID=UPI00242A3746|nr:A-kinase anchor protein 2 isoform X1 [Boleophthalmus pectinirostris]
MSCEEAQLHKERLQALAEKRKRQAEIEDKRHQLDDLVLQLQHVKSKAMRERWLLQGTVVEEEEARRKQLEQDEEQGKRLEDIIQRLESEIEALESEESQISAKEQVLRERLKETERSIEDLQKSLMNQDGDATGCMSDRGHPSVEQLVRTGPPASGEHATSRPAMFAMEINVQRDPHTGEQRVLSASRVSPSEAATRGVKVYDDGKKVVYEVTSSGAVSTTTMENGWSSSQVEQLIQQAARPVIHRGDSMRGHVTVSPAPAKPPQADDDLSPPSCAPPSIPSSPPAQVTLQREPQLGMMPPTSAPITTQPGAQPGPDPQVSTEHPVTMVFLGYQDVEDTSESRRLLGFDGAVKAEVVLIDEDDEKSLREKTVTDISAIDGTAADLVSGRPATSEAVSTELSSEGREPDSASSPNANQEATAPPPGLTPPTGYIPSSGVTVTTANGCEAPILTGHPHTATKSWLAAEDVSDPVPRERALKSVSFQESVSVITDSPATMELESQQIQHGCLSMSHNAVGLKETPDSDVVQEICYLDQVLDAASDAPTNGDSTEHPKTASTDGFSPSSCSPINHQSHEQHSPIHTNGHVLEDYGQSKPKFELRAFHEERKPAKLFSPGDEQPVRVTRRRPSEEVQELERERQELIKDQAVKKNPGIATRWWNPPQEVPLEEQLEAEQLESLKKYQERKQQRQTHPHTYTQPQLSGPPTVVSFDPQLTRKEDIVEEQIDFRLARKQFLQDNKKDIAPHIYSAKPFSKPRTSQGNSDISVETGESHVTWSDEGIGGDFTCARAVMTILPEDEEAKAQYQSSFHPEESDSGLDELSVRSQDTTNFSLDNVSDSGASLPPTPQPLTPISPPTPQPTTPINGQNGGSPSEEDLDYHAGVLVENAIQNALAAQNGKDWQSSYSDSSAPASPPASKQPLSSSPLPVSSSNSVQSSVCSSPEVKNQEKRSENLQTPSPPTSQPVSPAARPKNGGPRIKIQSSYARALAASAPSVNPAPAPVAQVTRPTPVYRPPSPPSPDKPEFSYFSKYSEAAELRSTAAVTKGPEVEPASGPFRLRSKKQKTLSMIEEEIRAAQEREEELKKQRENQPIVVVRGSGGGTISSNNGPVRTGVRKTTISPADKMKSNSLPTRLTMTAKTAPGKIEKVRPAPPVSPSPSEGALSDAGSEDSSGSSRPKNFMQTLMEDYETHKVKRREKMEDSQVLEATRVTRRKSDMAMKWEAGIYTNEEGQEEEEEEEEE